MFVGSILETPIKTIFLYHSSNFKDYLIKKLFRCAFLRVTCLAFFSVSFTQVGEVGVTRNKD